MQTNRYFDWLFSEAGAGWVFGVVSLIGLLLSLLRRKVAQRILFKELSRESLVFINETVRAKVSITFDGSSVERLSQMKAEILNKGSEVIKDVNLSVELPAANKFLDVSFDGDFGSQQADIQVEDKKIMLRLPFLNPVKEHNHRASLSLVLDGKVEGLRITGSGEGWSVRHEEMERNLKRRMIFLGVISLVSILIGFAYLLLIEWISGIDMSEVSWRAFWRALPAFLILLFSMVWSIRLTQSMLKSLRHMR